MRSASSNTWPRDEGARFLMTNRSSDVETEEMTESGRGERVRRGGKGEESSDDCRVADREDRGE